MSNDEKNAILKQQISVMRDKTVEYNLVHDNMVNKMFALLGSEIAISGLFASSLFAIPYPATLAGKIFFYLAIGIMALSVAVLLFNYKTTKNWPSPMGVSEVALMNSASSEQEALKILYDDYRTCYMQANQLIDPRAKSLNAALLLFVAGSTILIVLKFGG